MNERRARVVHAARCAAGPALRCEPAAAPAAGLVAGDAQLVARQEVGVAVRQHGEVGLATGKGRKLLTKSKPFWKSKQEKAAKQSGTAC